MIHDQQHFLRDAGSIADVMVQLLGSMEGVDVKTTL